MITHLFASRIRSLIFCLMFVSGVIPGQSRNSTKKIAITWEVVENNHDGKNQFLSAFTIINNSSKQISESGWSLYFNFVRNILPESVTGGVVIEHINGDLFRLSPGKNFQPVHPGGKLRVEFLGDYWVLNLTDAPAGLYWVFDDKPENGVPVSAYNVIPSSEPRQLTRFAGDKASALTPAEIFERNSKTTEIDEKDIVKIFPTPVAYRETSGLFMITDNTSVECDAELNDLAEYLVEELYFHMGKRLTINSSRHADRDRILLKKGSGKPESYTLSVDPARIEISASSQAGIFYGIQSLKTLIQPASLRLLQRYIAIPAVEVIDEPRFEHRAFSLDVARNFHSKQQLLKMIDLMALYKMNVLHLHLNDDEGWRLEIPGLPELTDIGGRRGHSVKWKQHLPPSFGSGPDAASASGSGYYSRQDFVDILIYARNRFIRVIPEIETPGHARAAIHSMRMRYERLMKEGEEEEAKKYLLTHPDDTSRYKSVQGWKDNVMDPGLPSTYAFIEKVVDELLSMYNEAHAPITAIHVGGDEVPSGVWTGSPASQSLLRGDPFMTSADDLWYYFFHRVNRILRSKNLFLHGWEEVALRKTTLDGKQHLIPNPDFLGLNVHVDVWNNLPGTGAEDLAYRLANSGYKVVLSCVTHLYLDLAYEKAFDEPGYYWGGFVDVDKPFSFVPFDYFSNVREDHMGAPLDRQIVNGKERLTDYGKTNIVGIQGLIWSENMISPERMEYQAIPKLLGVAERAWSKTPDWANETDSTVSALRYRISWSHFANVLGKRELPRLDYYHSGFRYRIPAPGLKLENGMVKANIQFPGLTLRYTTDGKEPTSRSRVYDGPIPATGTVKVKAFTLTGRTGKTSTWGGARE